MPDIFVARKDKEKKGQKKARIEVSAKPSKELSVKDILDSKDKPPYIYHSQGQSYNPLSSFCYFPENVKFVAKDSNERIVLFLRKHPITNLKWMLIVALFLFAPTVLKAFPILDFLPDRFQFIAVAMWYMLTVAVALESFLDWFFSVCLITDERIFDVDFINLVYREINEADIDQIQDVTVRMSGVIRTIFNYGDVFIQTAGEVPRIEFTDVPNPDKVAKILRELGIEEEQEKLEGRVR